MGVSKKYKSVDELPSLDEKVYKVDSKTKEVTEYGNVDELPDLFSEEEPQPTQRDLQMATEKVGTTAVEPLPKKGIEPPIVEEEETVELGTPLDLIYKSKELGEKQIRTDAQGGAAGQINTPTYAEDKVAKEQSKKIKKQLYDVGIDADKIYNLIEGAEFSDESKANINKMLQENPKKAERVLANKTWKTPIKNKLSAELQKYTELGDANKVAELQNDLSVIDGTPQGTTYEENRNFIKTLAPTIRKYSDNPEKDIQKLATETRIVYGSQLLFNKDIASEDRKAIGLNDNQSVALDYLEDVNPSLYQAYRGVLTPITKEYANDYEFQLGREEKLKRLEEIGLQLKNDAAVEELNNSLQSTEPDALEYYDTIKTKLDEIETESGLLQEKYTRSELNDRELFADELLGFDNTFLGRAANVLGKATYGTIRSAYDIATAPFMSDEQSQRHLMKILGEEKLGRQMTNLPQSEQMIQSFKPKLSDKLKSEIEIIKQSKLSDKDKRDKVLDLLRDNPKEWERQPIDPTSNVSMKSMLYGVSDLAATLVPFIAGNIALGGGASASGFRKFVGEFGAAAMTMYNDALAAAQEQGSPNPYATAFRNTAINAFTMAGAGTASQIRKMALGSKNVAIRDMIGKMTDDEITKALRYAPKEMGRMQKAIQGAKNLAELTKNSVATAARVTPLMMSGGIINQAIDNGEIDGGHTVKEIALETLKFSVFNMLVGGRALMNKPNEITKTALFEAAANPTEFRRILDTKLENRSIDKTEYDQINNNISNAESILKTTPLVNGKGQPLNDKDARDLLFLRLQEKDLTDVLSKNIPKELADKVGKRIEGIHEKMDEVYKGTYLSKVPEQKTKSTEPDTKLSEPIEGVDEQGVPNNAVKGEPEKITTPIESSVKVYEYKGKKYEVTDNSIIEVGTDLAKPLDFKEEVESKGTLIEQAPLNEVSDVEYNDFIDKGKVLNVRLEDIANKVKNKEALSDREKEIFTDKTSEINKIIAEQSPTVSSEEVKGSGVVEGSVGVGGDVGQKFDIKRGKNGFEGDFLNDYELIGEGSEHTVYRKKGSDKVIRLSEPYSDKSETTFNQRVRDAKLIDEIIGDGSLNVIGYYESENGTKNPIYEQNFQDSKPISEKEVEAHLRNIGGIEYGDKYNRGYLFNHNGKWYKINDYSDNFFKDKNGKIVAIDAAIVPISEAEINKARENDAEFNKAVEQSLKETTKAETPTQEVKTVEKKNTGTEIENEFPLNKDNRQEFTTKSGRQKVVFKDGELEVLDIKTNAKVSDKTKRKAVKEYAENFDFTVGKKSGEIPQEVRTDEEAKTEMVKQSENPFELAEIYVNEEPTTQPLSTTERMIADYGLGKVKLSGYQRFGDRNKMTMGKAKSYISKEGGDIDSIAKEMSDYYEVEITPLDIVEFMDRFPNGVAEALKKVESNVAIEAAYKFQQLTGLKLNKEIAEKAINQQFEKLNQEQQKLIQQDYETAKQLEDAYWAEYAKTDGFTKESVDNKIEPTKATQEVANEKEAKEPTIKADEGIGKGDEFVTPKEDVVAKEDVGKDLPKTKEIADKVRALKVNLSKLSGGGLQSNVLGLPIEVWNKSMDIIATTIEVSGDVALAIKKGLNYIQQNHRGQWNKKQFNDEVLKELGVRGITVNGEDLIVKPQEREFAKTVNGWYSDLEQSVLDVKGEQGRGENWIKVLGKSDEAKWTGLNDWLSQQKGQVSKKDIQNYLKDNRIQVVEVVNSGKSEKYNQLVEEQKNASRELDILESDSDNWSDENYKESRDKKYELNDKIKELSNKIKEEESKTKDTKFENYQLEGEKENYREVLVTMPSRTPNYTPITELPSGYDITFDSRNNTYAVIEENQTSGKSITGRYHNTKEDAVKNAIEVINAQRKNVITGKAFDNQFKSSHFDEPNILVHLRMNTRVDVEGKKVLFLEEVQSDWGQKGKKEGFKQDADLGKISERQEQLKKELRQIDERKIPGKDQTDADYKRWVEIQKEWGDLTKQLNDSKRATTQAPFVTDTNSWTKLGLKVALKEAVKQGADKIAWTTGEQQNERYDLSKQVDYIQHEDGFGGTKYVDISTPSGLITFQVDKTGKILENKNQQVPESIGKNLADVIGKDITERILNSDKFKDVKDYYENYWVKEVNPDAPKKYDDLTFNERSVMAEEFKIQKNRKRIEGEGLKIGGKGMKGFYGSPTEGSLGIVGNVAKSLFKQEPKTVELDQSPSFVKEKLEVVYRPNEPMGRVWLVEDNQGRVRGRLSSKEAAEQEKAGMLKQREAAMKSSTQHSIDITPELKAEAEYGLPLFKDIKGRGKEIADLLRRGKIKINALQSNIAGIPIAIYNAAIETIALALEGGASLTQAISNAFEKHKLDKIKDFNQKEFIKNLEDATGEKFEQPLRDKFNSIKKDISDLETEYYTAIKGKRGLAKENAISKFKENLSEAQLKELDSIIKTDNELNESKIDFSFLGLQEVANEFGLTDITSRERKSDVDLFSEAKDMVTDWVKKGTYEKNISKIVIKGEEKGAISDIENVILGQHISTLRTELNNLSDINSAEYGKKLNELDRLLKAANTIRSTQGAALRVPILGIKPRYDLPDMLIRKKEALNVSELTEEQTLEIQKEYEDIKKRAEIAEAKNIELEKKIAEYKANQAIKAEKKQSNTPKTKDDFVKERQSLKEKLKKQLQEYKENLLNVGIIADGEKDFIMTTKIAKTISDIVKSHVEEVGQNLAEVTKKVIDEVKDVLVGITEKDIHEVMAGKYNEKKPTKTKLELDLAALKKEVKLIDELDKLQSGQIPNNKKQRLKTSQKIKDIQDQIKDFKKSEGLDDRQKLINLKKRNEDKIQKINEKIANKDFEETPKSESILDNYSISKKFPKEFNEAMDSQIAKEEAEHKYEVELLKDLKSRQNLKDKTIDFVKVSINTITAIKSGIDDSFMFIQGLPILASNWYQGMEAISSQWKDFFSEKRFRREIEAVHNNKPLWDLIQKSGLDYLDPKSLREGNRDEILGKRNWLNSTYKVGNTTFKLDKYTTAPFERLYTSLGNNLRLNVFVEKVNELQKEGKTFESHPQLYKDLGRIINEMSGRGKLHKKLEPATDFISMAIWSPKLLSSTLNILGLGDALNSVNKKGEKGYYTNLSPEMRKFAIANTVKAFGTLFGVMFLWALNDDKEVDLDPSSVTFGQVKDKVSGNSYNILGRFTSVARILAMLSMGKKTIDGQEIELDKSRFGASRGNEIWRFTRGKFNPVAGEVSDFITQKTFDNKQYTVDNAAERLLVPMSVIEISKGLEQQGYASILKRGIPSFVGVKVSNTQDFMEQDLKEKEWKFLADNGLRISNIEKSTLKIKKNGKEEEVNTEQYNAFMKEREDKIKSKISTLLKKGLIFIKDGKRKDYKNINSIPSDIKKEVIKKAVLQIQRKATEQAKLEVLQGGVKEKKDKVEIILNDQK